VVIAAKNEQDHLADCLRSVAFADELILIDDYSQDRTASIARAAGAKVFTRKLDGFATQKNFGIDHATHDWVLILDADERVSKTLRTEMRALQPARGTVAYSIPFRNYVGKKWLRWGGLYPDRHIRLFHRRYARYGSREVHEMLDIHGRTAALAGDIIHLTYASFREYLDKVHRYATLEAETATSKPRYRAGVRVFLDRYIRQQGFRDGMPGLASAALLAYYQIVKRWAME
jgi:glycosyltransferase involved in cell wall biosynthesis